MSRSPCLAVERVVIAALLTLLGACSTVEPVPSSPKATPVAPGPAPAAASAARSEAIQTETGSRMNTEQAATMLAEHNRVRQEVGVPPLSWSAEVARFQQAWLDKLAAGSCGLQHNPRRSNYGENLFIGTRGYFGPVEAARSWEEEKRVYRGEAINDRNYIKVGHYTQMVWRETRELGCGIAQCRDSVIIGCNYSPPGNFTGRKPY